ncbi:MGMT family protein [candidate division WOR-3 bacterium]|nr:MGMT family protein [candidate division WOR-3 bacterium]
MLWQDRPRFRVFRILLPGSASRSRTHSSLDTRNSSLTRLVSRLELFLDGSPVCFDLRILALDQCTDFRRRALLAESRVPRGRVTTYARLAARVGAPSSARAVGRALATNPFPLVIPCHRAIRSDGSPGGFQGGLTMKRALLEQEDIRFSPSGRVVLDQPFF